MDPNQVQELLTQASWTPVINSAGVFEISNLTNDLWNEVRSSRRSGSIYRSSRKHVLSFYKSFRAWHIYASIFKYGITAVLFAPLACLR
jgi:hypothetical protein